MWLDGAMEATPKTEKWPPTAVMIGAHRYYTVAQGTRVVGTYNICETTLSKYAKAGKTPFGLDLGVVHSQSVDIGGEESQNRKRDHLLIPEDRLRILSAILRYHKLQHQGPYTAEKLANMRRAATRHLQRRGMPNRPLSL
ncbi:hypothetical protein [Acidicapsa acidisoli]|uniref:hypothetical protein n=1 Tax=Acidicapsa acidisoli TaxID=1615681 RepID=UPI0021E07B6D|nr:hypothetical protein [Acidicapsa acidisoli]